MNESSLSVSSDSIQEASDKVAPSPLRETHPSPNEMPHHPEKQTPSPVPTNRKRQRRCDEDKHENGVESPPLKNEFTTFGHHIASQLQALPLADAVSLQAEIQCLITSTRLRLLSKASHPQPIEYPRPSPSNNPPVDMNGFMLPGNVPEGMHANQCFNYNANY